MQQGPSLIANLVPIAAVFAIFYFMIIRPQQQRAKEHEDMLKSLKKGDRVLTSSGFYGTITALKGHDLELTVAPNVKLLFTKSAVARLAPEGADEPNAAKSAVAA